MTLKSMPTNRDPKMRLSGCAAGGVLLAAAISPLSSFAVAATLSPHVVEIKATLQGVASVRQLAASAASQATPAGKPIAMPRHRYPDGSLFGPRASALPQAGTSNVTVHSPASLATQSVTGFTGLYEGANLIAIGGELEPPDQGLAVNNGKVVEIINNSFQIFSTSGASLIQPINNATFFGTGNKYGLSDPHVIFDDSTQRWFVEELIFNNSFNGFAVAVSKTSDPLGSYDIYYVDDGSSNISRCKGSCFPDYPQVGYDENGFYIGADLFSNVTGNFVSAAFYALPKAALESGASFSYVYFLLPDFVVQPAIPAPGNEFVKSAGGTEFALTARNIYDGSSNLRLYAISNTSQLATSPLSLTASSVDIAAEAYTGTVPSTEPNHVGPYGRSIGATTAPMLDGGYNAFGGGVKLAGEKLYAALTTGSTDGAGMARNVIAWFEVMPEATQKGVTGKITAQGYIVPPNGYSVSYPAFALDKHGKGLIGESITSPERNAIGGYPSTAFVDFAAGAPGHTITVVGAGATSDDGFTGYPPYSAGVGRWGDYAGGTVDAVTGDWYVANEFIPNTKIYPRGHYANWGTYITQVHK
jgi:hypothetical protein